MLSKALKKGANMELFEKYSVTVSSGTLSHDGEGSTGAVNLVTGDGLAAQESGAASLKRRGR